MRIPRVHVEAELVVGDSLTFDKDRAHYLKHVLRLQPGAAVDLFNGDGKDYRATLLADSKALSASVDSVSPRNTESKIHTTVLQAIGKADHLDWMIQKTTELGVNRVVLFNAEHTQHPLKPAQLEKKSRHWRAVAISACEQCGRARIPEIMFIANLQEAVSATTAATRLVLEFDGEGIVSRLQPSCQSIALLTGPEGGLSQNELEFAQAAEFQAVSLGPRVLRFETAAMAALATIGSHS